MQTKWIKALGKNEESQKCEERSKSKRIFCSKALYLLDCRSEQWCVIKEMAVS